MKIVKLLPILTLMLAYTMLAVAGEYHVNISIIDTNLYETGTGAEIETEGCDYQAEEEDSILEYIEGRAKNKIYFQNRTVSCRVVRVMMH